MYGASFVIFEKYCVRIPRLHGLQFYSGDSSTRLLQFLATMPKVNTSRIADAQRQRVNIQKKSEKYSASTVYLQVLGSGAPGASNSLYLFTDQKRYLFNCGEGTQRLAHEHKVKLSRLDDIFITRKTWNNLGGLPGLSLTLQDVGVPNLTLHGPDGLDELYNATRRFVVMKDMNIKTAKCSPNKDFVDNVMTVKYVLMGQHDLFSNDPVTKRPKLVTNGDKEYEEFIHDDTDYYLTRGACTSSSEKHPKQPSKGTPQTKQKPKIQDIAKRKSNKVLAELQKQSQSSVAFICMLKNRLGSLNLAKCVELGVKPGPNLGKLKNGQDVILSDGTLVLSKDVKTPDDPGPIFIVLDVSDLSYLKEEEFKAHFDDGTNPKDSIPTLIVHFTPSHIFRQPQYQTFMGMFGKRTRHLVLNDRNDCLGSEAVHRSQYKLHLLDSDMFPLLGDISMPVKWDTQSTETQDDDSAMTSKTSEALRKLIAQAQFENIMRLENANKGDGVQQSELEELANISKMNLIAGRTLMVYHLRPKRKLDRSAEPKIHIQDYIKESLQEPEFPDSLELFRRRVEVTRQMRASTAPHPKVIFLGTGSCIPSKTRNTSGIVVIIDEKRSMILDCGEGTYGQLVRFYGPKKVKQFLLTLQAIYVSHLHADHHIGLIGLLQARRQAHEDLSPSEPYSPVLLLAPGQIMTWLSIYDQHFETIQADFALIPNQGLVSETAATNEMTPALLARVGLSSIEACYVSHCPNAFGVALTIDDKNKITYSGDTIPCENLVKIGANSTLLIHEATMDDELEEEARVKMHSTASQAIEVGKLMRAQYTVLTHFSQRYARLPRLNTNILESNVGIAFDNMQLTMSDLDHLPHMYDPLKLMFAEHCVDMENRAAIRNRKREREASPASPPTPAGSKNIRRPIMRSMLTYKESKSSRLRLKAILSKSLSPSKMSYFKQSMAQPDVESDLPFIGPTMDSRNDTTSVNRNTRRTTSPEPKGLRNKIEGTTIRTRNFTICNNDRTYYQNLKVSSCIRRVIDSRSKTLTTLLPNRRIPSIDKPPRGETSNFYFSLSGRNGNQGSSHVSPPRRDSQPRRINSPDRYTKLHVYHNKQSPTSPPYKRVASSPESLGTVRTSTWKKMTQECDILENAYEETKENTYCRVTNSPKQDHHPPRDADTPSVSKPNVKEGSSEFNSSINFNTQRVQLIEIKRKFRSRKFWNDSKYDKIEGLNWISWE